MKQFSISGMPRVVFGRETFGILPKIIRDYGRKVLVVTGGSSFKASGRMDQLSDFFAKNKISMKHLEIDREPSPRTIDRAAAEYRRMPVNAVIAIGGGSVLDAGKAIAAMIAEEGSVLDYLEGVGTKKLSGVKAPFIAVPTTAGTGSEATKNAVLSEIGKDGFKKSLRHDAFIPDVALIDPCLMTSCSPALTASCGLDALSQLLESYFSTGANPFTDALAESGLQAVAEGFVPAYECGENVEARERMAYASLMSGVCLAHAGLGTVHGIAGPLGGRVAVPHGAACGTLLSSVLKEFAARESEWDQTMRRKFISAGRILDGNAGKDDAYYIARLQEMTQEFTDRMQIPRLGSFGLTDEDCIAVAQAADNKASPVKLDQDAILSILRGRL